MRQLILSLGLVASLAACGKGEDRASYCEAVCDNAVSCAAAERTVDETALMADCLEATRAADPQCAETENGDLGVAAGKLLDGCLEELAATAGECDAFTGRIDDQVTATTPGKCLTYDTGAQDTFDAARDSTTETNDQLCERFSDTFCEQVTSCIEEELGEGFAAAVEAVGLDPKDNCLQKVSSQTDSCKSEELYAPEESATDVNLSRQTARECMQDFATLTCEQLFSGDLPPLCAGAVEDPTAYAGLLLDVAVEYRDAAN